MHRTPLIIRRTVSEAGVSDGPQVGMRRSNQPALRLGAEAVVLLSGKELIRNIWQ